MSAGAKERPNFGNKGGTLVFSNCSCLFCTNCDGGNRLRTGVVVVVVVESGVVVVVVVTSPIRICISSMVCAMRV